MGLRALGLRNGEVGLQCTVVLVIIRSRRHIGSSWLAGTLRMAKFVGPVLPILATDVAQPWLHALHAARAVSLALSIEFQECMV